MDSSPAAANPAVSLSMQLALDVAGDVLVGFTGTVDLPTSGNTVNFDFTVDGTRQGLDDGIIVCSPPSSSANTRFPVAFTWLVRNVAAGTHTITLQWKSPAGTSITMWAGAGTSGKDVHPQYWAVKV